MLAGLQLSRFSFPTSAAMSNNVREIQKLQLMKRQLIFRNSSYLLLWCTL
jgi:hypothetical protein